MDTPKDISTLFRKMTARMNTMLTQIGLTTAQSIVIFCLYDHEKMTQTDICNMLEMDKSTVAKMLPRLEKEGLITKERHESDARAFYVRLTEKAVALVPKAKAIQSEWLEQVTANFTAKERDSFYELIERAAIAANDIADDQ